MESSSQLSSEIKKIADKNGCYPEGYIYSTDPINSEEGINGYPYIDQVIYREWSEGITFKSTSTVFERVGGEIKWFKSKVDSNKGNPIFISGEIDDNFWEPINNSEEANIFVKEFVYSSGAQTFVLDATPSSVLFVSLNGSVLKKIDFSISSSILTILPPNVLDAGSEITVVGIW